MVRAMADKEIPSNVTPLRPGKDRTAAARARRFRKRRKSRPAVTGSRNAPVTHIATVPAAQTVTPAEPKTVTPTVTETLRVTAENVTQSEAVTPFSAERQSISSVTVITLIAALSLATVSAGFSITGMTSIFVGAFWPVIGMGVALELGKLSAVAWLGRAGRVEQPARPLKTAVAGMIAVLMALNAIGAYGFLAKAHIEHAIAGQIPVIGRAADVDARLSVHAGVVADLDRQLAQIDSAVEKTTAKGRTASAMRLAEDQRKTRADLAGKRIAEAKTLAALQVEKAAIEGERAKVEADFGPVRYLAILIGAADETVMRWFILAIALLLDPAAVLLLLAATRRSTP